MSMSLGHKMANSAVALSLVFGLTACGEADFDLQRKPELVDLLMNRSMATCIMQKSELDQAPYQSRLKDVLMETKSTALDFMKSNGITICLDQRLSNQETGFFSYEAQGVYYPKQKIVSLWDNGKVEAQAPWYGTKTATDNGPTFLNRFANNTFGGFFSDYSSVKNVNDFMLAHKYRCCGKHASTHYDWETASDAGGILTANPALQVPPVMALQ